ncbi:NAD-dependent epimerase/dehydratase family protein [Rheinheimera fenheensis]|uniref:NAD-dependent epimerase/dehydratase family protein n=1 Tax=Rheinheimera fenheensis TaxID=3152295 RepID=UPI00325EBB82
MKVVIVGCGWLGSLLAKVLVAAGHSVTVTQRSEGATALAGLAVGFQQLDLAQPIIDTTALETLFANAVVVCAITPGRQQQDDRYYYSLTQLADLLQRAGSRGVIHFSSSGIYQGLAGDVTEQSALVLTEPRVARLYSGEQALQQFQPCMTLRLAGLMGPGRHPARFSDGKALTDPDAAVNMVHSADICRAVIQLLSYPTLPVGTYNLVCPQRVSRVEFYQQAARHAGTTVSFAGIADKQRRVIAQAFIDCFDFQYQFACASAALLHCG